MRWTEVVGTFSEPVDDLSLLIDELAGLGCPNTLESTFPCSLTVCLAQDEEHDQRLTGVTAAFEAAGAEVSIASLEDQDWIEAYRKQFHARRIGKSIVVTPSWESPEIEPGDIKIVLDPGLAFGTGDHPTTRMCLEILEEIELAGKSVADIGCGTGILSILAAKRGAAKVVGVDIEAQSVEVALENGAINQVAFEAHVGDGLIDLQAGAWDVVVSNIISATLINLAPGVSRLVKPGGLWVVSGVIEANWPDVLLAAEDAGFELEGMRQEEPWVAATFIKDSRP